jgi:hypothetical protein
MAGKVGRRPVKDGWVWTRQREKAARLCADGRLTDARIAAQVGVSTRTLERWRVVPEFQAKVDAYVRAAEAKARECAIGNKLLRVQALHERRQLLLQIAAERAADPSRAGVPGGGTGLLVRSVKQIGSGATAREVEEYEVDATLLRELRAHEEQAARELGQWTEKTETDNSGPVILSQVIVSNREDARAYLARLDATPGATPVLPANPPAAALALPSLADALAEDKEEDYLGPEGL